MGKPKPQRQPTHYRIRATLELAQDGRTFPADFTTSPDRWDWFTLISFDDAKDPEVFKYIGERIAKSFHRAISSDSNS